MPLWGDSRVSSMRVWSSEIFHIVPPLFGRKWSHLPFLLDMWGPLRLISLSMPFLRECFCITEKVLSFWFYRSWMNLNCEGTKHFISRGHLISQLRYPLSSTIWKGKMIFQRISLKDIIVIPDTTFMHIAANFTLNEPLMYADLTSYFAMMIFIYGLDFLSAWM